MCPLCQKTKWFPRVVGVVVLALFLAAIIVAMLPQSASAESYGIDYVPDSYVSPTNTYPPPAPPPRYYATPTPPARYVETNFLPLNDFDGPVVFDENGVVIG